MDLMLVLLAVTAFPVACLAFVLWMGVLEDSIPAGVRRAAREPDPPPVLAVPVRRTPVPQAVGWWDSVAAADPAPTDPVPELEAFPGQRVAAALSLPVPEPLTGT